MTENPYVKPVASGKDQGQYLDFGDFQIDGNYLICTNELMLPEYCIISGEEHHLEFVEDNLVYVSYWECALKFAALPILLIPGGRLLFVHLFKPDRRDCCRVSYFIARRYVVLSRLILIVGSILVTWSCLWLFWVIDLVPRQGLPLLIGPVMPLALAVLLAGIFRVSRKPLKLRKLRQGCFWLSGFRRPFVRRLEEGSD